MFDGIARRYDVANTVMTLGLDAVWRRRAARAALDGQTGASLLDCAFGTGKLASAAVKAGALRVVGVDFSEQMIAFARAKHPGVEFITGDVLHLPFADGEFAAATIGFGLRNLEDPLTGLREMARVVRPGGRVAVLEAVRPEGRLRPLLRTVGGLGPRLAGAVARDSGAYRYLSDTVRSYATAAELGEWLFGVGLGQVRVERLGFGAVALVVGQVP